MSNNSKDEFNTVAHYNLVFIPFIENENDVKWAVYDTEFTRELDSTTLLLDAITNEVEGEHIYICKDRLDAQAQAYNAKPIFNCNDENALEYLQNILGEFDAEKYLERFGFKGDNKFGFSKNPEEYASDESMNIPCEPSSIYDSEVEETSEGFHSLGSVPISDDEYWDTNDACTLLRSALVFKQREIDNNIKGSVKEAISDALAVYAVATAATGPSTVATLSGLASILSMGYNAKQEAKDRDEILKDWALFRKDRENSEIPREDAYATLRKNMQNSSFAYEGVPDNITNSKYQEYKPFFIELAKLQGHFDAGKPTNSNDPITADKVTADKVKMIGDSIRNIKPEMAKAIGLNIFRAKHASYLGKEGFKEIGTDLKSLFNFNDNSMRAKMYGDIKGAGKITVKDIKHRQKDKLKKEEEAKHHKEATKSVKTIKKDNQHTKSRYKRVEDDDIQTVPDIIHAKIDYVSYERYIDTLEQLPRLRKDKVWAEANYANVSSSMAFQMSGLITGILTLNPLEITSNAYGILTGIGAYAQTASNVETIHDKLHGKLAEGAEHHEYVQKMQASRLKANLVKEHFGINNGDRSNPDIEKMLDSILEDNTPS